MTSKNTHFVYLRGRFQRSLPDVKGTRVRSPAASSLSWTELKSQQSRQSELSEAARWWGASCCRTPQRRSATPLQEMRRTVPLMCSSLPSCWFSSCSWAHLHSQHWNSADATRQDFLENEQQPSNTPSDSRWNHAGQTSGINAARGLLYSLIFPVRTGELWPFVGDFLSGSIVMDGGAIFSPERRKQWELKQKAPFFSAGVQTAVTNVSSH